MKIKKSANWRTKIKKDEIVRMFKKIFSSRRKTAIVVIVVLLAAVISWRVLGGKKAEQQFQTTQVEKGTIVSSISASGQILTANITNITTGASGLVEKIYVTDGDQVGVGQKIAEIQLDQEGKQNQAQAYSSYLSAKNSLASAKTSLYTLESSMWAANQKFINDAVARNLATNDPTYIQQNADWLAAEAKYINQQDVIKQAEIAVNNAWLSYQTASSVITAPVSGTINSLTIAEGMQLGSQQEITSQRVASIISEGTPLASFNISEIDITSVKPGQKATITLDSIPDKTFTGKVVSVDRIGTSTSGVTAYPVIIQFDTSSEQILSNMAATAEIITEIKETALWIPPQAIRTQAGQTTVRVLVNGKPQDKQVEVGLETSSQAEIISGLSEGETVVVSEVTAGEEATFGGGGGMRGIMPGGGFGGGR